MSVEKATSFLERMNEDKDFREEFLGSMHDVMDKARKRALEQAKALGYDFTRDELKAAAGGFAEVRHIILSMTVSGSTEAREIIMGIPEAGDITMNVTEVRDIILKAAGADMMHFSVVSGTPATVVVPDRVTMAIVF